MTLDYGTPPPVDSNVVAAEQCQYIPICYTDPTSGECLDGWGLVRKSDSALLTVHTRLWELVSPTPALCDKAEICLATCSEVTPFLKEVLAGDSDLVLTLADIKALVAHGDFQYLHQLQITVLPCHSSGLNGRSTSALMTVNGAAGTPCAQIRGGGSTYDYCGYSGEDLTTFYGVTLAAGTMIHICGSLSTEPQLVTAEAVGDGDDC